MHLPWHYLSKERVVNGRVQLKRDGTRWRTGGEVMGKLPNGVGSQYSSHYLGTLCIHHYYRWCRTPRLTVVDWTDAPADLNGLVRFAERNLVSARVPSHFKSSLLLMKWSSSTQLCFLFPRNCCWPVCLRYSLCIAARKVTDSRASLVWMLVLPSSFVFHIKWSSYYGP